MSDSTPRPEEVIERTIRRVLADLHTVRVGYIAAYDAKRGEADVQPADMAPFRNELGVRVPYQRSVIPHVPVYFPGGGGARDTWPVAVGDACIVLHTANPIARWLVQGGIVDENNDAQRHNRSNSIALVGISDFAHFKPAHATARVVGEGAATTLVGGQDATDPAVRKSDLDAVIDQVNAIRTALLTHTHLGVTTGVGTSGSPTPGTVGSAVTKPACSPVVRLK